MAQVCQHCGFALPMKVDAFCPECRNDLSETPRRPATPQSQKATREEGSVAILRLLGWLALGSTLVYVFQPFGVNTIIGVVFGLMAGGTLLTLATRRAAHVRKLRQQDKAAESTNDK